MCMQAHFQPGFCEQLGPSLASSLQMFGELTKALCSFLTTHISLVNFWLVCWFDACPNQDHNLRLAKPLVVAVCLPPRPLLLLTLLLCVSFFPCSAPNQSAPSSSQAAGFHDLPHPDGITALTELKVGDRSVRS